MRPLFTLALALLASPAAAQSAADDVLVAAQLLGPARMESAGAQLTIFGEAGPSGYVAALSGTECSAASATACDTVTFTAFAPPSDEATLAAWNAAGHGGEVVAGEDGWLVFTAESGLGGEATSAAFTEWASTLMEFNATFGN